MKIFIVLFISVFAITLFQNDCQATEPVQDMRAIQKSARKNIEDLKAKALADKAAAEREQASSRQQIINDKSRLQAEARRVEGETNSLENAVSRLAEEEEKLIAEEQALDAKLGEADAVVKELVGVARIQAKDMQGIIDNSLGRALEGEQGAADKAFLTEIAEARRFPALADLRRMNAITFSQLRNGGAVRLVKAPIVDRGGNSVEAEVLALGDFTAAYRIGDETGFLNDSPASNKLFALSRLPSRAQQKELVAYMEGESEAAPIDVSRGAAISQLIRTPTFDEQVLSGGPLVWPILLIPVVAIFLLLERVIFLWRGRIKADDFLAKIEHLAENGPETGWRAAGELCGGVSAKPLARVLGAGIAVIGQGRDAVENGLQEAILKEIPPMERFLSTLSVLAAIAPLLGLLGTVTGMIDTFEVITMFGTGDPRMMSGGISVALVTTMLGLMVAIPIMLAHALLSRSVENRIAELEEKSVALVNFSERLPTSRQGGGHGQV
ncbi:MAG: MotA/TolQ/ExbB proton channel family protein [Desulfobulbaceae bacterium]|jgi:biopolymer transport protein ExbB|nr:MotA/TolQ/ExbB proton channel family protein [Desulfobulbaceae bacterium]